MTVKPETPPPPPITCPGCGGNGSCLTCKGLGEVPPGTAPEARSGLVVRAEAERDTWRDLANALMAFVWDADVGSSDMQRQRTGPWAATPPSEIVDALRGAGPDSDLGETVRAAVLGRAYRIRGKVAEGTCDYPLCPRRPRTPQERREHIARNQYVRVGMRRPNETREVVSLHVCAPMLGDGQECKTWAEWVAARFAAGRIRLERTRG